MMPAWQTVEDAIHAWAVAGSGLPAESVIWATQQGPRPTGPYLSLRLTLLSRIGQDWVDREDVEAPEEGAELRMLARGAREVTLTMQAFAGTDGAATGAMAPVARLSAVMSAASLPSIATALSDARIGIGAVGPVQSIDGVLGSSILEPRAVLDVRVFLASEVAEHATFIEHVQLNNQTTDTITWVPEEPAP